MALSTAWQRVATGQRWLIPLFLFIFVAKRFDELGVVEFSLRTFASATFEFWIGRIEGVLWFKDAGIRRYCKVGTEVGSLGKHVAEVICRCIVEIVGGQAMQPVDRPNDAHDRSVLVRDIAAFCPWADAQHEGTMPIDRIVVATGIVLRDKNRHLFPLRLA